MRVARSAYLVGALAVAGSRLVSAAAAFASLWLLSQILTKDMLGGYAFAFNVVLLAAPLATLGLERSLLLRIAAEHSDGRTLGGGRLALQTSVLVAAAATAVGLCLSLLAGPMARLGAIEQGAFWLGLIGWAVIPFALTSVLQSWFQANHRVPEAVVVPGLGDAVRTLGLAGVLIAGLGAAGVAWSVLLSAAAPAAVLAAIAIGRSTRGTHRLGLGDLGPAANFLVIRFATQAAARADLVLLGLLASAGATAEYAIAAQLALLSDAGRLALKPNFAPRMRYHLSRGARAEAQGEYEGARFWAQAAALAAAAGLVLFGGPVLGIFGDFRTAYGPLLLLAAGYVITSGAGMHMTYLNMTGETGWSALLRVLGLGLLVGLALLLIPIAGPFGAAWAVLIATLALNVAGLLLVRRLINFVPVRARTAAAVAAAATVLVLTAHGIVDPELAAGLLLACLAWQAMHDRSLRTLAARIRNRSPRGGT